MTSFRSLSPLVRRALLAIPLTAVVAACDPQFGVEETRQTTATQRVAELRHDLRADPSNVEALRQMGKIYADQGLWVESMGAYREALIVAPSDRLLMLGFGRGQLAVGDYAGAYKSAQQAGGGDVEVMLLRSGALAGMNRLTEARTELETARQMAPRDLDVRSNLGLVAALQGDATAYAIARAVAFAPDAEYSHIRNMVLVGGITGNDASARYDAERRGLDPAEIGDIIAVGRRARTQGMRAFTVLTD